MDNEDESYRIVMSIKSALNLLKIWRSGLDYLYTLAKQGNSQEDASSFTKVRSLCRHAIIPTNMYLSSPSITTTNKNWLSVNLQ